MTIEESFEIGFTDKLCVFVSWTLKICGVVFIWCCIELATAGVPKFLRQVELASLNEQVEMLGYAMTEVQDVQVSLVKKGKK